MIFGADPEALWPTDSQAIRPVSTIEREARTGSRRAWDPGAQTRWFWAEGSHGPAGMDGKSIQAGEGGWHNPNHGDTVRADCLISGRNAYMEGIMLRWPAGSGCKDAYKP